MVAISLTMTGAFGFFDEILTDLCEGRGTEIANSYTLTVEHYVCSKTCPCPMGKDNDPEYYSRKWWNQTDDMTLILAYRVKTVDKLNEDQEISFRYYGDEAGITPMIF